MRLSLVIPMYNEAEGIAECLAAVAAQTVQPYEVIVVDNNSTDDSVAIASRFPFVTVLHEVRQGVVHARNTGFEYVSGEIIGRIDADTILAENWVEAATKIFHSEPIDAITGKVSYKDLVGAKVIDAADLRIRRWLARKLGRNVALQGANMAVRKTAWNDTRPLTCNIKGLHEDFDLAIHLTQRNYAVAFEERLEATIAFRRIDSGFIDLVKYSLTSPLTYAHHKVGGQRYMYPVVMLVLIAYWPVKVMQRCYNAETNSIQLKNALSASESRVSPAAFVE